MDKDQKKRLLVKGRTEVTSYLKEGGFTGTLTRKVVKMMANKTIKNQGQEDRRKILRERLDELEPAMMELANTEIDELDDFGEGWLCGFFTGRRMPRGGAA